MNLDIGCGDKKAEGYKGLDIVDFGQEFVCDALKGIPYPPAELFWEQIRASHFVEHLTQDEAISLLNDCHSKCKELYIIVPSKKSENAWVLTHKTFYTESTFTFLERDDIDRYGIKKWEVKKIVTNNRKDIHVWLKPLKT